MSIKTVLPRNEAHPRQDETAAITRGVCRLCTAMGHTPLTEMTLGNGRRADVVALSPGGDLWIIEVKSSVADFRADRKWPDYLGYCDQFSFAVGPEFPVDLLPDEAGLIIADGFGGATVRQPVEARLPAARRRALLMRFANVAGTRLARYVDPDDPGIAASI